MEYQHKVYTCKSMRMKDRPDECVNYYRAEKHCIDIDEVTVYTKESFEKQLLVKDDVKKILIEIMSEEEPVRTLLILRLLEELPFGQIGETLGKSELWCRITFYRKKRI